MGDTVALIENASGTGIDLVAIRGKTNVTVDPENGVVRVTTEWPPWTNRSFVAPYTEHHESSRGCAPVRESDPVECHEHIYLRGLDISWRDRPAALMAEHHKVRWVLEHGAMRASSDAEETAVALGQMLGLGAFEWEEQTGYPLERVLLHEPEDSTAGYTSSGGQWDAAREDALQTVSVACVKCNAFRASPRDATLWFDGIEWVVDPDGFVAWVESYQRVDWAEVDLIPVAARDSLVRQYADAHDLEPRQGKLVLDIDFDDRTLYWQVFFHGADEHKVWRQETRLNALDGSWTIVNYAEQPRPAREAPPLAVVALVPVVAFAIVLWRPRG